jgi:hypothetical protein
MAGPIFPGKYSRSYWWIRTNHGTYLLTSALVGLSGRSNYPSLKSSIGLFLVEPDSRRRASLIVDTRDRDVEIVGDRIEDVSESFSHVADFVLCQYVLQHIRTDLLPQAISGLKSVVKPGGSIGIFSSVTEGDPYFQLAVSSDEVAMVPKDLVKNSVTIDEMLVATIGEEQFNNLIDSDMPFNFVATHHFNRQQLVEMFPEFTTDIRDGGFEGGFLLAN